MYGTNPMDDLREQLAKASRVAARIMYPRPARPKHRKGKSRKRLSMRPEKRPQTIMEQYKHRELLKQEHNRKVWEAKKLDWWMAFEAAKLETDAALLASLRDIPEHPKLSAMAHYKALA
jgi:hypothetical protein